MLQFLPFVLGILSGSAAVKAARSRKAREGVALARAGLEKTGQRLREGLGQSSSTLRDATLSSLSAIEQGSARLREKLEANAPASIQPALITPAAEPAAKPAARKPRARKPAAVAAPAVAVATEARPRPARPRKKSAAKDAA